VLNSIKRAAVVMLSIVALGEKPSAAALAALSVVLVGVPARAICCLIPPGSAIEV